MKGPRVDTFAAMAGPGSTCTRRFYLWTIPLACVGMAAPAQAWGPVGHETIAIIAADHLRPAARKKLAAILGRTTLARISNWADWIRRERPETAPWHFIDIPDRVPVRESDEPKFCPDHACVVDQIELDAAALQSAAASRDQKLEALKFLVHFVGDVHQPLHCADDHDRGGNEKFVRLGSEADGEDAPPVRLHAYWDHLLEIPTTDDPGELAQRLEKQITPTEEQSWQRGTPADWAWESYLIAKRDIFSEFKPGPTPASGVPVPSDYAAGKMRRIVDLQLEKAGIRLAYMLNAIFTS